MRNVLVISASPRKGGNSDSLCEAFMRGAAEAGHRVEKIFLRDRNVNYCIGCEVCLQNGGTCVQEDDMAEILEKMISADAIVMATPVYFYSMDAQIKTLIDRTVARYTKIKDKEFYFIMTAAEPDRSATERTLEGFRGFADCLPGAMEKGIIYGTGLWKKGDAVGSKTMVEAYEMGKSI